MLKTTPVTLQSKEQQIKSQQQQSSLELTEEQRSHITRRGLMFVLSAPSGSGKTTLKKLLLQNDEHVVRSISVTTRDIRPYEVDGVDYIFTDVQNFKKMVDNNEFLEYAKVFDNYYGTPRQIVEENLLKGIDVLFDIDWQGHRQLTSSMREDVTSVFILPPSKNELVKRLRGRDDGISASIRKRLEQMNLEINHWHEYDYVVVNDRLQESVQKLLMILRAERLRKNRRTGLSNFVSRLMNETLPDNYYDE
jgi:guanylate kinase